MKENPHFFIPGIHDRFNICDGSLEEVRSVGAEVRDMCLVPAIKLKSREADIITRAFIEGSHAKFKRQGNSGRNDDSLRNMRI